MAHKFLPNDCDETQHGTDRETGRGYSIIGWVKADPGPGIWPILIPDEIALGEPLPIKAERTKGQPVIIPDGM